jgi:site-specific recombinase XerD
MKGADLKTIQEILDHHSLVVTQRYAHLSLEHKQNAMRKLVDLQRKPAKSAESKIVYLGQKN